MAARGLGVVSFSDVNIGKSCKGDITCGCLGSRKFSPLIQGRFLRIYLFTIIRIIPLHAAKSGHVLWAACFI